VIIYGIYKTAQKICKKIQAYQLPDKFGSARYAIGNEQHNYRSRDIHYKKPDKYIHPWKDTDYHRYQATCCCSQKKPACACASFADHFQKQKQNKVDSEINNEYNIRINLKIQISPPAPRLSLYRLIITCFIFIVCHFMVTETLFSFTNIYILIHLSYFSEDILWQDAAARPACNYEYA